MANEEQLTLNRREELLRALSDLEYRCGFVEAHAKDTIAFQLRQLRKAEGWEQRDVAERLGNPNLQPMISRYENPDYGRYSISTLLELAFVFDVALVVRFAPFSELLEWDWASGANTLRPASYAKDERIVKITDEIQKEKERVAEAQACSPLAFADANISKQGHALLGNIPPSDIKPTRTRLGEQRTVA